MRFLVIAAGLSVAMGLAPLQAAANCACLCVDGARKTVCTTAEEVGANQGLCAAIAAQGCPDVPEALEAAETYEPPAEGVANCRDAQVYDRASGGYLTAKVCDTASSE